MVSYIIDALMPNSCVQENKFVIWFLRMRPQRYSRYQGILVPSFQDLRSFCTVRKSCVSSSLLEERFTVYLTHKSWSSINKTLQSLRSFQVLAKRVPSGEKKPTWRLIRRNTCAVKLDPTISGIIREDGFNLYRFFYVYFDSWIYIYGIKTLVSGMADSGSREKSATCPVR